MFQLNMLGLSSDDLISMTLNDIYQPTNPESDELPKELRWPILVATDGFTGAQAEVGGARPGPCEGQHWWAFLEGQRAPTGGALVAGGFGGWSTWDGGRNASWPMFMTNEWKSLLKKW